MQYYLSLGSNLGERKKNLEKCRKALESNKIKILRASSIYETQPVGFKNQPWFLNQVVAVEAPSYPEALLDDLKRIENRLGRKKIVLNGPRIIDIDILMADQMIIRTATLQIPHPRMEKRNFILIPFEEIAPTMVHPVLKRTLHELRQMCPDSSSVKVYQED